MKFHFSSREKAQQAAAILAKHYAGDGQHFSLEGNAIVLKETCSDLHHATQICRLYGGKIAA